MKLSNLKVGDVYSFIDYTGSRRWCIIVKHRIETFMGDYAVRYSVMYANTDGVISIEPRFASKSTDGLASSTLVLQLP